MSETIQQLIKNIEGNSLLVTLFSGGIIITLFMHAKNILTALWNRSLELISFEIINRFNTQYEQPEMLKKLLFLLNEKSKILWMNKVELVSVNDDRNNSGITATPHGYSYRFLYGKFIIVDKFFETEGMKITTSVNIRVFFCFKKTFFSKFLEN